ncbi:esterase family protein [Flavihumibacter rivuli]|uniref:alpha/beta hydrolase-fold protein n=1 Tax=Flavihumibacter rivuli TaxID=2838156 RepID=UPI001BDF0325|nr:alpha/beta hydrolase-fold protein [Flavihumibacter rivuli]ULQ56241.1 esterase family protein [Flavihumibacter rivuli]
MKRIALLCCACLMAIAGLAQTASDYYQSPIDTSIASRFLGEQRGVTVILPRSFSKAKASRYPVIVVFDRQNKRIFRQTFESINYLYSFDELPEAVIIGVASENNQKRFLETSLRPSTEQARGEQMVRFLYEELLPWAEKEWNVGRARFFIGHSRFGYFSSYLLSSKLPDLSGVISLSPFYVQPKVNLVDSLSNKLTPTQLDHTVYYRFVTGDSLTDTRDYDLMQAFLTKTKPSKEFNWKGMAFYNARHMAVPGLGLMPSLVEIFDYWSEAMLQLLQSQEPFSEEVYNGFKQQMKRHYGEEIGLGLSVLNGIGYKFYNQGQYAHARAAWMIVLQEYPMFTEANISIANAYLKEGDQKAAAEFFNKAKQGLIGNGFYSREEVKELEKEIEEGVGATKTQRH